MWRGIGKQLWLGDEWGWGGIGGVDSADRGLACVCACMGSSVMLSLCCHKVLLWFHLPSTKEHGGMTHQVSAIDSSVVNK